jgi:hypothetical protein
MAQFPSLTWPQLQRVLKRKPLRYVLEPASGGGSGKKLTSREGYPDLILHFHDKAQIAPGLVRNILVKQVGLTEEEALQLL